MISPITTYALRGQAQEVGQIGRELGARYVVRGTVRRRGEQVRVAVHLVDSLTAAEIWAQLPYRRTEDREEVAAALRRAGLPG